MQFPEPYFLLLVLSFILHVLVEHAHKINAREILADARKYRKSVSAAFSRAAVTK